ncbi:uncharacterized protein LOC119667551 [Teleopsis dalmanni]|uniref:uncharacterized protein LOC119667551 n=1 Tax=Teleopsis dalmanni TaxID=139649 RepID=UPI0018CC85E3|nr:uncharacterized protein LOC119667551 [Teleopsis dalmanni]
MSFLQTPMAALRWLMFGFGLLITLPVCFAGPHEKRLLHSLLDNYNSLERPVVNESDPLQLSFGLTLMQIIDVTCMHLFALQLMSRALPTDLCLVSNASGRQSGRAATATTVAPHLSAHPFDVCDVVA